MRDLGREEPEGGQALVFPQHVFALEDAGVKSGVLECDRAQTGEGGAEAFFVVVEAMDAVRENGHDAEDLAFKHHRRGQHGAQRRVGGHVGQFAVLGRFDVGVPDLAAGVDRRGEEAVLEVELPGRDGQGGGTLEGGAAQRGLTGPTR